MRDPPPPLQDSTQQHKQQPQLVVEPEQEAFSSGTALLVALITWVIYWWFLRPRPNGAVGTTASNAATTTSTTNSRGRTHPPPHSAAHTHRPATTRTITATTSSSTSRSIQMSQAAMEILQSYPSLPPHIQSSVLSAGKASSSSMNDHVGLGGSNVLLSDSGLVAFAVTKAAAKTAAATAAPVEGEGEAKDTTTLARQRQKDRAKILSRLCSPPKSSGTSTRSTTTTTTSTLSLLPPSKGSTVVVGISQADLGGVVGTNDSSCISRVLDALATFYNVIVVVAVNDESNNINNNNSNHRVSLHSQVVQQLRSSSIFLSEDVLPSHRILLSSTVTGRVALVRQLSKVALVVDWDPTVKEQLTRFGFAVTLVEDWNSILPLL